MDPELLHHLALQLLRFSDCSRCSRAVLQQIAGAIPNQPNVHQQEVVVPRDLGQVQADELRANPGAGAHGERVCRAYVTAFRRALRTPLRTGEPWRPRLIPELGSALLLA
jgi:hypothetical protein